MINLKNSDIAEIIPDGINRPNTLDLNRSHSKERPNVSMNSNKNLGSLVN